jgi:hypothetical protein
VKLSTPIGRGLAAAIAVALLITGVVATWIVASHGSGVDTAAPSAGSRTSSPPAEAATASPPAQGTHCFESMDNPHCDRYLADLARRVPVQAIRGAEADKQRERIDAMMPPDRHGPCEYIDEPGGACSVETLPPTAGQVRAALGKAGYPTAVIRTARPDDPAPAGSLLLAVPAGRECVLLFAEGGRSHSWIAGRLPGGACLRP